MRVTIAAVGRDRAGAARELFDDYCRRCSWPIRLVEIAPRSALPLERRLADEGARLTGAIPQGAILIALDERGRLL
ncbi:MAG: 23S rRNA (pseudouridine(1915)-N(3))-methyltransferase RlmH, partial [Geminicoccaceae bacterium]